MAQNVIGIYHLLVWDDYSLVSANLLSTQQSRCPNDTLKVVSQVMDAVRVLAAWLTMYGISSEMLHSCLLVNTAQTWNLCFFVFLQRKNWESEVWLWKQPQEHARYSTTKGIVHSHFSVIFGLTLCIWIMSVASMHSTKQSHYANICSYRNIC
jgi:hypothetical protein